MATELYTIEKLESNKVQERQLSNLEQKKRSNLEQISQFCRTPANRTVKLYDLFPLENVGDSSPFNLTFPVQRPWTVQNRALLPSKKENLERKRVIRPLAQQKGL